jgi:hypothetical protein
MTPATEPMSTSSAPAAFEPLKNLVTSVSKSVPETTRTSSMLRSVACVKDSRFA